MSLLPASHSSGVLLDLSQSDSCEASNRDSRHRSLFLLELLVFLILLDMVTGLLELRGSNNLLELLDTATAWDVGARVKNYLETFQINW